MLETHAQISFRNSASGSWLSGRSLPHVSIARAEAFDLKPRDVIYVDPTPLVRWNRVISLILPSAGAVQTTRTLGTGVTR